MAKFLGGRQNKRVYLALTTLRSGRYAFVPSIRDGATLEDWLDACAEMWKLIEEEPDLFLAKEKQAIRNRSEKLRWMVFKQDGFTCRKCGSQEFLELDHINPISKGGKDDIENLQTLCKPCNRKKSNKL